jgi:hypothetical protein
VDDTNGSMMLDHELLCESCDGGAKNMVTLITCQTPMVVKPSNDL